MTINNDREIRRLRSKSKTRFPEGLWRGRLEEAKLIRPPRPCEFDSRPCKPRRLE